MSPPEELALLPEQTDEGTEGTASLPETCLAMLAAAQLELAQADCTQGLVLTGDCHQRPSGHFGITQE